MADAARTAAEWRVQGEIWGAMAESESLATPGEPEPYSTMAAFWPAIQEENSAAEADIIQLYSAAGWGWKSH
jgi:hypothetical protein